MNEFPVKLSLSEIEGLIEIVQLATLEGYFERKESHTLQVKLRQALNVLVNTKEKVIHG